MFECVTTIHIGDLDESRDVDAKGILIVYTCSRDAYYSLVQLM